MRDYYGEAQGQRVADVDWIRDIGAQGYVAFHKDANIRRRANELAAVDAANLRMFVIPNASITGQEMVKRFYDNFMPISNATGKLGPYIYGVYEKKITKLHP